MNRDVCRASAHPITVAPLRLLGGLCLLWLFWNFDMRAVALDWLSLGVPLISGALLLSVGVFFLKFARWTLFLRCSGIQLPFGRGLAVFSSGLFWGLVSPGRLGEFSRCAALKRTAGIPMERTAALIVSDRLFDLAVIAGAFLVALCFVSGNGAAVGLVLSLFSAGAFLLRRPISRLFRACLDRIGMSLGLGNGFLIFRETWSCSFSRGGVPGFGLSVASVAVLVLQGYLIAASGCGLAVSPMQSLLVVTAMSLGSLLPLSICGFGTNDVMVLGLVLYMMPELYRPESWIAFSLSLTVLNFLTSVILSGAIAILPRLAGADDRLPASASSGGGPVDGPFGLDTKRGRV
jgi:glycosyltransferase 2 family protein